MTDHGTLKQERIRDTVEFRRALILGLGLLGGMALLGFFYLYNGLITKKYMAPFYRDKATIVFGESDVKTLIDDPKEVKAFQTAIITAQDVTGHHSHPVEKMMFVFLEESSKVYFLGDDSSNAGEFWLEAAGDNGPIYLKQFRSEALTEWLRKSGVR